MFIVLGEDVTYKYPCISAIWEVVKKKNNKYYLNCYFPPSCLLLQKSQKLSIISTPAPTKATYCELATRQATIVHGMNGRIFATQHFAKRRPSPQTPSASANELEH